MTTVDLALYWVGFDSARHGLAWQRNSACVGGDDPDQFFAEPGQSTTAAQNAAAQRICRDCPVQAECLEYALVNGERYGVWGGKTPHQRSRIINKGNITAAVAEARGQATTDPEATTPSAARHAVDGSDIRDRVAQVIALTSEGLSATAIARRLNCSDSQVLRDRKAG